MSLDKATAIAALEELGVDPLRRDAFFQGGTVVYSFATESDPGIAVIELAGLRLRSGIIEINDIGGGLKDFLRLRTQSRKIAVAVGAIELEIFGGAIINERIERFLIRQRFQRSTAPVPEELGGGTMDVLTRVFLL